MTKAEEILNEYGCPEIPFDENVTMFYPSILSATQEYGKYFAEEAWKEAIQQYATLSLSNMVNGQFVMKSFDEWWSEFQRKEETK